MKDTFDKAVSAILSEREYQDRLWGPTGSEGKHSTIEFLVFMKDYIDEALHTASRHADGQVRDELADSMRKITSMGIACMEQNGIRPRNMDDLAAACFNHDLDVVLEECNEE
jgi:hypothetical protein